MICEKKLWCFGNQTQVQMGFGDQTPTLRKSEVSRGEWPFALTDTGAVGLATYVFVRGIRARLKKRFADQGGVARPNYFDKILQLIRGLL